MRSVELAVTLLGAIAWAALVVRAGGVVARILQIEEYEVGRTLAWGRSRAWLLHRSVLAAAALTVVAGLAGSSVGGSARRSLLSAGWLAGNVAGSLLWSWIPPKKELVVTPRMRRLLIGGGVIAGIVGLLLVTAITLLTYEVAVVVAAAAALAATATALGLAAATKVALLPVEARINAGYVRHASARIREWAPEIVAIAGSYGKTSTKHILGALLAPSTPTLVTPKSFNTLMGVTRTVNEHLRREQRTFVVEMDAYDVGEIAAICRVTPPLHAVVTSVGPQHLERFGSMERIADALHEVIAALPPGGTAVVYAGDDASRALAARAAAEGTTVVRYGMDGDAPGLDVVASDLHVDGAGSHFRVRWSARGVDLVVHIPLLGSHQVLNTAAAIAVVCLLGHDLDQAVAAAAALEPIPHRLQPVPTANGITVIDDSYNANPVGVHNGLDVLAGMPPGQRILVTPGLVELGSLEDVENRRYGDHAARVCDHVIVVSSRPGRAVLDGLRAGGLDGARIHEVRSLAEATAAIGRLARPGDSVLFANDLPDTYLEPAGRR